ncbi:hypothetical protein [Streptomyces phaeochromogenes]
MKLWIVAQVKSVDAAGWAQDWDFAGAFTSEDKARDVCTEPGDCMWAVESDTFLGRETVPAPGMSFPAGEGS